MGVPRRARQFMYMQDVDHLKIKEKSLKSILNKSGALEWSFIKHDQDIDENGKLIRPHYHVILKYYLIFSIRWKYLILQWFVKEYSMSHILMMIFGILWNRISINCSKSSFLVIRMKQHL